MAGPRVISVNIALPKEVAWGARRVSTGIYKEPALGRVEVRSLGLEGDGQADLRVHGGPAKAVYAYPSEHYAAWRRDLGRTDLPWGTFGENLTTAGLLEADVHLGDRIEAGTATLEVTRPRFPCFKLGNKFGSMEFVGQFAASRRTGFYLSVVGEGAVAAGDAIRWTKMGASNPTVREAAAEALSE